MVNNYRAGYYDSRARYNNDPQFKALVDMMTAYLMRSDFTPSEIRLAATMASVNYEFMHIERQYIVSPELEKKMFEIEKMIRDSEKECKE